MKKIKRFFALTDPRIFRETEPYLTQLVLLLMAIGLSLALAALSVALMALGFAAQMDIWLFAIATGAAIIFFFSLVHYWHELDSLGHQLLPELG